MHLPSSDAIAVLHNSRALFNAQGGCDVWIVPFLMLRHRLCNRSVLQNYDCHWGENYFHPFAYVEAFFW